jgi:hypothetical protein
VIEKPWFWGLVAIASLVLGLTALELTSARFAMPYFEFQLEDGSTSGMWCQYDCRPSTTQIILNIVGALLIFLSLVFGAMAIRARLK